MYYWGIPLRILGIFVLALSLHISANENSSAQAASFFERFRPIIREYLGPEMELKLLGKTAEEKIEDSITMPKIPEVKDSATSLDVYNKKADKIILSKENEEKYFRSFVRDLYKSVRRQDLSDEEAVKYLSILYQGGAREGIYRSLVLDGTYAQMENYDMSVSSRAADLVVMLYGKYLGKEIQKEKLKGMNFYTAKRLVAERALEIVDSFGEDRESIENWYAVMSADLASQFAANFANNLRKNPNKSIHKKWAQSVPVQHIKSEVVIKIHTAMNALAE